MKNGSMQLVLTTAALAVCGGVFAAQLPPTRDSGTTFVRDALQPFVDSGELHGGVSVYYDDGYEETACVGYADLEAKRPTTLDCLYMPYSMTKGFCGVTVAMMIEDGRLNLDDPVSKFLREFRTLWVEVSNTNDTRVLKKAKNVMTVRMVMNHMSGLPFESPCSNRGWNHSMPLRSLAAECAALPLKFEPGTGVQYSNLGIDVGAAVVEVLAKMPWEEYLDRRVFKPLEMTNTTFRPGEAMLANRLKIYRIGPGQTPKLVEQTEGMQAPYDGPTVFPSAGAGLWSTPRDMLKFYKMLMNLGVGENGVRILKEETVKKYLLQSSRPKGKGGCSLGLAAPEDPNSPDPWVGFQGAINPDCWFNWRKRQLRLWAVQNYGGDNNPWDKARRACFAKFAAACAERRAREAK